MSIIPGMENLAPLRTDTSSGFSESPSCLPAASSSRARWAVTSRVRPTGKAWPPRRYSMQVSVVMVKPLGTGSPRRVISATFAPLPPSRSRISRPPSEKSYTRLVITPVLTARPPPR